MTIDVLNNSLLKARIIAWVIFSIPIIIFLLLSIQFIIFSSSEQWDLLFETSGENAKNAITLVIVLCTSFFIVISLSFWFTGRYFVERTKAKIYKRELDRLQKRTEEKYPERLEDFRETTE